MPKTIIFLENHFDSSIDRFLFNNAEALKDLGYKELLFELYEGHEPSLYIKNINDVSNNPNIPDSLALQKAKRLVQVYEKFSSLGILCRFIDPEHEDVGARFNQRLTRAFRQGDQNEYNKTYRERCEATKQRDISMAKSIQSATECYDGGVLFVCGFLHHHLVEVLQNDSRICYSLFYGDFLADCDSQVIDANKSEWLALRDPAKRADFYKTDAVRCMNPDNYSFEMISATLKLCSMSPCEPSIRPVLRERTGLPFDFFRTEQNIVSATLAISAADEECVVQKIKSVYPRVYFFSEPGIEPSKKEICIPGINLQDQRGFLK